MLSFGFIVKCFQSPLDWVILYIFSDSPKNPMREAVSSMHFIRQEKSIELLITMLLDGEPTHILCMLGGVSI